MSWQQLGLSCKNLRLKGRIPAARFYLYYEVERLEGSEIADVMLQSDYETKWAGHNNVGETRLDGV